MNEQIQPVGHLVLRIVVAFVLFVASIFLTTWLAFVMTKPFTYMSEQAVATPLTAPPLRYAWFLGMALGGLFGLLVCAALLRSKESL